MKDINSVNLTGRLTRVAELKSTSGGQELLTFSMAVNTVQKKDSEWVEKANFIDCILWGPRAGKICQYLTKGIQVSVSGELRQESWDDKDGKKRSKIVINVSEIVFMSKKDTAVKPEQPEEYNPLSDNSIPF